MFLLATLTMSTALTRKQNRRKAIRKELEFNLKECKGAIDDPNCSRVVVLGLKGNLDRTINQLTEIDEEILNALDPDSIEDDMSESMTILRPSYEILAGLTMKLEKLSGSPPIPPSNSSVNVNCKLPDLELPVFKGQPLKWRGFWDQFEVAIDRNDSLSDINKFNYLKRFLTGEALSSISGLALTSDNYKEAVDILKKRYGNPQVLITAYMETLLKLSKVKGKDVSGLRKLFNEVENCLRSLRSLKVETSTYGSLLLPLLKDKVPDDFLIQIGRRFGTEVWTLDLFMTYFEEELVTAENCLTSLTGSGGTQKMMYTTSSFYGQVEKPRHSSKPPCVFCSREGHTPSQCKNVSNVRSRKGILRRSGRCFVCLERGHRAMECPVEYICRICKQRHNISICENRGKKEYNERNWERNESDEGRENGNDVRPEVSANVSSTNTSCILLQTGTAEVGDVDGNSFLFSKILFDSGSQMSYVTEGLARRLGLKVIRKENIVIKTFGRNDESKLRRLNVVRFKVRHRSQRGMVKYVEALCIPTLCSPLSNQCFSETKRYDYLASLDLADDFVDDSPIDVEILIGCDFYHSFFTGRVIHRGNEFPTASESILGWVLSGPTGSATQNGGSHCMESHVLRCETHENDALKQELNKFWEIENIDVVHSFQRDNVFNESRYVVKLPFKPDHELIPDNFDVCRCRLKSLKRKLDSNNMVADYGRIFDDHEKANLRKAVDRDCWFHVPGTLNPADRPTRMCKNLNELFLGDWFEGPKYLRELSVDAFPFHPDDKLKLVDAFAECKANCSTSSDLSSFDTLVATCASEHVKFAERTGSVTVDCSPLSLNKVLSVERFSSLKKLVMTHAYVQRFIHNTRMKVMKKDGVLMDVITA